MPSTLNEFLEKALDEKKSDIYGFRDFQGHVNGIKGWLDDLKDMVGYGNFKTADASLKQIKKAFKDLEKSYNSLKKGKD